MESPRQTDQGKNENLRVAVAMFPPFIMDDHGKLQGFEIELWERIASELGLKFHFDLKGQFADVIPSLQNGTADVALAGITRTEKREKTLDFSHRTFDSGLHILVRKETTSSIWTAIRRRVIHDDNLL